jgi:putative transposase
VSNSTSSSRIMRRLTTLFPSEFLEREGKLQLPVLVWALVFGFRRSYNSTADETISPGGFYHRLTPKLAEYRCSRRVRGCEDGWFCWT